MGTFSVRRLTCVLSSLFFSGPAFAVQNFTPTSFLAFTDATVESLIRTVSVGGDHHAYMPATPLGLTLGVDIGIDVTYVLFPSDFTSALALATSKQVSELPGGAPLPKLNIHKGLPFGFDIGGTFSIIPDGSGSNIFKSYGLDLKWAFLRAATRPTAALRLSGSYNSLYFIQTRTYSVDLLVSKNLIIIDPFVGAGLQIWSGEIAIPAAAAALPITISPHQSGTTPHVFGGLLLNLALLKLTTEIDYSSGLMTLGGKVSFGF